MSTHTTKNAPATVVNEAASTPIQYENTLKDIFNVAEGPATLGDSYLGIADLDANEVIHVIRTGVPAKILDTMARDMHVPRARVLNWIDVPAGTIKRKITKGELLDKPGGERALALATLIGQVERMVSESGDPQGFDAPAWLANWLSEPNPSFGGACPGQLMDTAEGMQLVSSILSRMQTGAYA